MCMPVCGCIWKVIYSIYTDPYIHMIFHGARLKTTPYRCNLSIPKCTRFPGRDFNYINHIFHLYRTLVVTSGGGGVAGLTGVAEGCVSGQKAQHTSVCWGGCHGSVATPAARVSVAITREQAPAGPGRGGVIPLWAVSPSQRETLGYRRPQGIDPSIQLYL